MNWIKVSDKLPPLYTAVLLFDEQEYKKDLGIHKCHSVMATGYAYERQLCKDEDEESLKDLIRWNAYINSPTHWMPLPKEPNERGSDNASV